MNQTTLTPKADQARQEIMSFITWLTPAQLVSFFNFTYVSEAVIHCPDGDRWEYLALDGSDYQHKLASLDDAAKMALMELNEDIYVDFAENDVYAIEYWTGIVDANRKAWNKAKQQ